MDVAIFDLETSNLNADFGIILCGVVKPYKGKPRVFRIDDYPLYKKDRANDREVTKAIRDELGEYDLWVSYNGKRFDVPFLNTRLMVHGFERMAPQKHSDIYWLARYRLKLHSARLAVVQEFFGLKKHKTRIDGMHWARAMAGYRKDMDYIVDHCVKDVQVLEEVYVKMKQFIDKISR
jgi:hypothetical protein